MDETTATAPAARTGRHARLIVSLIIPIMLFLGPAQATPPQQAPAQPATEAAFFQFDYPPYPERFIFELTDPATIQEARDILSGQLPSRHIMGLIVKTPVDYNAPWSYHLDPASVSFFNSAIEQCDAAIQYVEDHLGQVGDTILPDYIWCPWGSRLVAEVGQSATPTATATATATPAPSPTATATPTQAPQDVFLPLVLNRS